MEGTIESRRGPFRSNHRAADRRRPDRDRSVRPGAAPAVECRRAGRPLLPRLPQRAVRVHRRQGTAGGAHRARRDRRRAAVHPASGRVRARLDARADPTSGRPRREIGREELARPTWPADPLDGRLHRPGLGRPRDARALERGEPPDHDLLRDEDRPGLVRPDDGAGGDAVRCRRAGLEVPGTAGADAEPVLAELRARDGEVILVTGGTGFVGGHVLKALQAAGRPVRCLVRDPANLECELVQGDMTDTTSLKRAVEGVDTVVHLVAIRQGKKEQFDRIMSEGTRDLLAAAKDAGVGRFILMSALGTSEESKDLVPYYGAKWEMEQAVQGGGIPYVIFRPSFVFEGDGGILPTFAKLARLAPVTPITGSGTQRIQPIWADDVGAYFEKAVDLDAATNRTFELGGPDVVTWNEFWDRLKKTRGIKRPSVHVPMGLMRLNALVTERLPGNIPLTRDLRKMLEHGDNVATNDEAAQTFQLPLMPLDEQLRKAA